MKCINKLLIILLSIFMASFFCACKEAQIQMPFSDFQIELEDTGVTFSKTNALTDGFAKDYIVYDTEEFPSFEFVNAKAGALYDLNNQSVLYSNNAFELRAPASITKIMTCMLALKYCSLDETLVVTDAVNTITDPTATMLHVKPGDTMTLDQAIHLCLISSYNDLAIAIACHVSGTEEEFCKLMNEEALALGATSTHFTDASGLGSPEHLTSVYDLYLIFNEAIKYPEFLEVIRTEEYSTVYHDKNGHEVTGSAISTNKYYGGTYEIPANINVLGGKTGTTDDAGRCLTILVRDKYSNPYIATVLGADSRDELYFDMSSLLLQIPN